MSDEKMEAFDEEYDEEELENIVYLSDEDGNEIAFEYLDSVDYQGDQYVVLISTDEDDDSVVILKVEPGNEDDDEDNLVSVDDDVAEAVFEIFREQDKEFFEFA